MQVSKTIEISAAHILDLPYSSKCNSLHGHNYKFTVVVEGEPNASGMVIDYAELGRMMHSILDDWDHKLFMAYRFAHPLEDKTRASIEMPKLKATVPIDDIVIFRGNNTTAEVIAKHFYLEMATQLAQFYKGPMTGIKVIVQETEKTQAIAP